MRGIDLRLLVAVLASMAHSVSDFWGSDKARGSTPHIGGHQRIKHKPHIPDGKWVMKHHRSRH